MRGAADFGGGAAEFRHRSFWALLEDRHPGERVRRAAKMRFFWQRALPKFSLVVTMYVSPDKNRCGVFLGRNEKLGAIDVEERLRPHAAHISQALKLDPALSSPEFPFVSMWQVNCLAEDNWPAMVDWMVTEASRFERTLEDVLGES